MNSKQALHLQFREDQWIRYNVKLSKKVGIYGSILLGYLINKEIYYSDRDQLVDGAYFYATRTTIEEQTALSPHQQREAIKELKECGFLVTKDMCTPRKTFYAIVHDKLSNFLTTSDRKIEPLDVENLNDIYEYRNMSTETENIPSTSGKLTVLSGKQTVVEHKQDTPLVKEEKEKYASIPLLIHAMFSHVFELADDTQYMISSYKTVAKDMKHHLAGRGDITIPAMTFIIHLSYMSEYEHLFSWHIQNKKRPRPEQILKWWIDVKKEYIQYTPPTKEEFEQMFSEIGLKMRPEDYDKPY